MLEKLTLEWHQARTEFIAKVRDGEDFDLNRLADAEDKLNRYVKYNIMTKPISEELSVQFLENKGYKLNDIKEWVSPDKKLPNDETNDHVMFLMMEHGYRGTNENDDI